MHLNIFEIGYLKGNVKDSGNERTALVQSIFASTINIYMSVCFEETTLANRSTTAKNLKYSLCSFKCLVAVFVNMLCSVKNEHGHKPHPLGSASSAVRPGGKLSRGGVRGLRSHPEAGAPPPALPPHSLVACSQEELGKAELPTPSLTCLPASLWLHLPRKWSRGRGRGRPAAEPGRL